MVWIMSEDSPVLLASFSDEFQSNYWEGIPESQILEKAHEGVCRAFNVDANSVPKPLKYIKKVWTYPTYPVFLYKKGIIGSDIQKIATKPFPQMPFYIASETLSQRIGWVEGALYSSNSVVKKILSESI
jgi:monoamine oxidase